MTATAQPIPFMNYDSGKRAWVFSSRQHISRNEIARCVIAWDSTCNPAQLRLAKTIADIEGECTFLRWLILWLSPVTADDWYEETHPGDYSAEIGGLR